MSCRPPDEGQVIVQNSLYMKQRSVQIPVRLTVWDRVGIWLSGVCMVHCLALPLLLLALPFWPGLLPAHDWIHPVFATMLVATTLPAAYGAWKRHGSGRLALLLLSGLVIVFLALWLGRDAGVYVEDTVTLLGSGVLIVGHWKNGRACATSSCSHPH